MSPQHTIHHTSRIACGLGESAGHLADICLNAQRQSQQVSIGLCNVYPEVASQMSRCDGADIWDGSQRTKVVARLSDERCGAHLSYYLCCRTDKPQIRDQEDIACSFEDTGGRGWITPAVLIGCRRD